MRLCELQKRKRNDLALYFLVFLAVQAALAAGVELQWITIRDPDYAEVEGILKARQAEAPDRPLTVVLGSSRTAMALRAERLNDPANEAAPLTVNCALPGAGPILQQLALRRMLHSGVRPQFAAVEVMPLSLSCGSGDHMEKHFLAPVRLSSTEVARICPYYRKPLWLWRSWVLVGALPTTRHHARLHDLLGFDLPADGRALSRPRRSYGWLEPPCHPSSPQRVPEQTRKALAVYHEALEQPAVSPAMLQALRDLLHLCRDEGVKVVLVVPPEGHAFRFYCPAAEEMHMQAIRALAGELRLPLIDARDWVDNDGFYDGHHVCQKGADKYTDRFGREVLAAHLSPKNLSHAPTVVRTGP